MGRIGRAAGIAVAGITLALGAAFAAPSLAEEAQTAATIPYTQHAATAPVLSAAATQDVIAGLPKTGAVESDLPAPVAMHAVATIDPVVEEQPESRSLSELVAEHASSEVADSEQECLAIGVYFEAKSEPLAGQLAVAEVILNRAQSGRFPGTVCGVLKQRGQFSFIQGGRLPLVPRASAHWKTAVAIAHIARDQLSQSHASNALYFHARRVSPGWHLTRVGIVGNHVFYR
jgi:N-acetylmuramoyl-L-alanine amidase